MDDMEGCIWPALDFWMVELGKVQPAAAHRAKTQLAIVFAASRRPYYWAVNIEPCEPRILLHSVIAIAWKRYLHSEGIIKLEKFSPRALGPHRSR